MRDSADLAREALARTRGELPQPDIVTWIESEFYIQELDGPMILADYQKAALREALSTDENGLYNFSLILWSDLKKTAKTSISAAVGLYVAIHQPWSSVRVVANDLKQAASRCFEAMTRAIMLNPRLRRQAKVSGYTITFPNQSRIEAVPVDPGGEAGGGDTLVLFDEAWAYRNKASQAMWTEMSLSPLLFGKSMRWVSSYAGFSGESLILEMVYQSGVIEGRRIHDDYEFFVNQAGRQFSLWNTRPRVAWLLGEKGEAYYRQESGALLPSEFSRLHRNLWSSASEGFLPSIDLWDICKVDAMPPLKKTGHLVLAVDGSVSNDSTAIIGVSRSSLESDCKYRVRFVREFKPPKGGQIDFGEVEGELRRLIELHEPFKVVFDPYQMIDMMRRLRDSYGGLKTWITPFEQTAAREQADKALYDLILQRRIEHSGEPQLRAHVQAANVKITGDRKLRIVKRTAAQKIDLTVALSMAAATASACLNTDSG